MATRRSWCGDDVLCFGGVAELGADTFPLQDGGDVAAGAERVAGGREPLADGSAPAPGDDGDAQEVWPHCVPEVRECADGGGGQPGAYRRGN